MEEFLASSFPATIIGVTERDGHYEGLRSWNHQMSMKEDSLILYEGGVRDSRKAALCSGQSVKI